MDTRVESIAENKFEIDSFILKIIAICAMTFNHIANVFGEALPMGFRVPFYAIGGLTFPIMAFSIVEGYHKTSNVKKYMLRILIFGLIALFPFFWAIGYSLNVLFTLLLGLVCLYLRDHMKNKNVFWLCFAGIVIFTILCDWALLGVSLIMAFGTVKGEKRRIILPVIAVSVAGIAITSSLAILNNTGYIQILLDACFFLVCLGVIPLLMSYHGKRGYSPRSLRYLFYIYYPVHLAVLAGINWLIK